MDEPNGPNNWKNLPGSAACGGKRQSPIAINKKAAKRVMKYNPIKMTNVDLVPDSYSLFNEGHGIVYQMNFANGKKVSLTGGPLGKSTYILHSFHLHWPSEHLLNGVRYSAELHLVHYKSNYMNLTAAKTYSDGLAVLGFLYAIGADNVQSPIFDHLHEVLNVDSSYTLTNNKQSVHNFIQKKPFTIFNYNGSLTTPTCNEAVTWMV